MTSPHPLPHTRTRTLKFPSAAVAAKYVAKEIDKLVRARNAAGKHTVLGLATGSTPVGLYRELIRLHKDEGLDLSRVVTFNLDEYYPMARESPHSYFRWMHETFFNHVNIPWENIHIPDGTLKPDEVDAVLRRVRAEDRGARRDRHPDPRHRPHRAHRRSTNPAARRTAAPGWSRSTASPAATRPTGSSARRTSRTRRSRWASPASSTPAASS